MDHVLSFYWGPPEDESLKELFQEYQEDRRRGERKMFGDWEAFEGYAALSLFKRSDNGGPSVIESIFQAHCTLALSIKGYSFQMELRRKIWVGCVSISRKDVAFTSDGGTALLWPLSGVVNTAVSLELASRLKREWVGWVTVRPVEWDFESIRLLERVRLSERKAYR